ncbi:COP23 domain-containing protein [Kamptonema formosum]|uniref:COP23 domain-containing protein n=1 Tax=Kamptonema formosum TaxID=331992 RepID=UPI0018E24249|nr:COP23 domain-containing protein [Oscillatoria sp. PCC 10802]
MQSTLAARILLTTLAVTVSGASPAWCQQFIPPASLTPIQSEATVFKCVPYGTNSYITLAEKADKTAALFLWSSENFGGKLSPERACNTLSQRMNDAVRKQGGNLNSLLLTMGRVNRETVICFVSNYDSGCNANNTLFALTPEDAKQYGRQPQKFLEKLTGISVQGSQPPVLQLAGNPINDIDRQPYFSLEAWEKQFLKNKYGSQVTRYK